MSLRRGQASFRIAHPVPQEVVKHIIRVGFNRLWQCLRTLARRLGIDVIDTLDWDA